MLSEPVSRSHRRTSKRRPRHGRFRDSSGPVGVSVRRSASGDHWVLVHAKCARERAEDIEAVRAIIDGDEAEIAIDELRWLLDGCNDFVEAHQLLGDLVMATGGDVGLARGHYGCAYELGLKALRRAGVGGPLPYRQPANRPFFDAGRRLAVCLGRLGKPAMAREVIEQLLACDPADSLGLRGQLDGIAVGGKPIVEI